MLPISRIEQAEVLRYAEEKTIIHTKAVLT